MKSKTFLKKISLFLLLIFTSFTIIAQNSIDCQKVDPFLKNIEKRIQNINTSDPELITLHYLFAKDIANELTEFYTDIIPHLSNCPDINFNNIINQFDWAKKTTKDLVDTLAIQKEFVYLIFYQNSYIEFNLRNYHEALYLVDRSLQFKELQADPLLLRLEILFQLKKYDESIDVLNTLYYKITLNEDQEKKTIDFNLKFYDHLYHVGDSLINIDKATEAFKIFKLLETFCNNMPSGYCNDDYYHGLLKSKVGVYESYIKIAKVARNRENFEMETKFLQYAEEYLNSNKEILFEMNLNENTPIENKPLVNKPLVDTPVVNTPIVKNSHVEIKQKEVEKKPDNIKRVENENSSELIYKNYQSLISDAIDLCIQQDFESAYDKFISAQRLEECDCFIKDARIVLFLNELRKIKKN